MFLKVLASLSLFFSTNLFFCQSLSLSLAKSKTTYEIGEDIELILTLKSKKQTLICKDKSDKVLDDNDFQKTIIVNCNSVGEHSFGPYILTMNEEKISSNNLKVFAVASELTKNNDTIIKILVPEKVKEGEEFTLILESNINLTKAKETKFDFNSFKNFKNVELKESQFLKQLNSVYSSSSSIKDGVTINNYVYTFKLLAKQKGNVFIDENLFNPVLVIPFSAKKVEIN